MIVAAPTVHFRTPAGVVVVDQGGVVPADVDEAQLERLIAAKAVEKGVEGTAGGEAGAPPGEPTVIDPPPAGTPKGRARK